MSHILLSTGRAGRDGRQSHAYILCHGILLNHVEGDIKSVLKTDGCRRKALFQHFETVLEQFHKPHLCCDNCASTCKCGESDCNQHAAFPKSEDLQAVFHSSREREVTAEKKKAVEVNLIKYHKFLVMWGGALRDDTKNGCVADYSHLGSNVITDGPLLHLDLVMTFVPPTSSTDKKSGSLNRIWPKRQPNI